MTTKPKTVPELRFPGFEGEWWRWLLDQFATRGSGHTPSKSHPEYYDGDIDWISLADSKRLDNGYIEKTKTKISDLGLRHSSAVLHPAGTVILSRDAGVGKSAVMKHTMAVSQHFIVWRPTEGTSIGWFIYYRLQIMKPEFERIAIGSTIKTIGLPYFKKLEISAPTLPEQRKIADFLTAVDGRIGQLRQKKALLEDYKKGVMQQLFTQALRFKDDHGNDFPEWEEVVLEDVVDKSKRWSFTGGPFGSNLKSEDYTDDGIRIIQLQNIGDGEFLNNYKIYTSEEKANELLSCNIYPGDLLLSKMGDPVARACIVPNHSPRYVMCSDGIRLAVDEARFDRYFVFYQINHRTFRNAAITVGTGSTRKRIGLTELRELPLRAPSLPEQIKIGKFLTALDRKIESVSTQITHTQTFKKGLLQQMFV